MWLAQVPTHWDIRQGDWHYSVEATRVFGLHMFARHSELTMGPFTVGVAWMLQLGGTNGLARALLLGWLLAPVALLLVERAALRRREERLLVELTTLVGGAMLLHTWQRAVDPMGHLDEVLAMTFAALAVWAVATRRRWTLVAAVALAAASKAWGVLLLPLCLVVGVPALGAAAALVLLAYVPFGVGAYTQAVDPASGLAALGVHAAQMPGWVRPAQVVLGLALATACVLRRRWGGALAAALGVRLALDPQVYGYYTPSFVLAALVLDLAALRRPLPVATLATYVCLEVVPDWVHDDALLGRLRLVDAAVLVVASSALSGTSRTCTTR
ncbi:MAG TPA: hypothetical protein VI408_11450 [Gaiellaceae bacterium]